jgi:hypothetical protein
LLLVWDVSRDQEEPWRRFLQELSDSHYQEYARSRRHLGVSSELVWLAPKPAEQALRDLAASDDPFDSWYGMQIRSYVGLSLTQLPRVAGGELLFAWHGDDPGEREAPEEDTRESG